MRRLLTSWMSCGSAMLALTLTLGCAPAEKQPTDTNPPAEKPADTGGAATETPATEGAGETTTPVQDAATERKDEAEAAGTNDPLDTTSKDPNVKLGEPEDPVNLK